MTDQLDIDIITAWVEAAKDLGVSVKTPFTLQIDKEQSIECILLVEDFGSKLGTIVFTDAEWVHNEKIRSSGYSISTLGESYQKYNRNSFIDMLNDWGYCGRSESKPSWYTGEI